MKQSLTMRELPVFVAVAEKRSFTGGAKALGISPSAASQAVGRLERSLATTLFVRTTRSVSLTDAGTRLYERARPAVTDAMAAMDELASLGARPRGWLRLSVPRIASRAGFEGILAAFAQEQPDVRVEVMVDDRRVDIVRDGFDAGVRSRESTEKDMIAVRLTPPIRFLVVGSKRYFAKHGRPKHPRDLVHHACLGWRPLLATADYRWEFTQRGRDFDVAVTGPVVSNDADMLVACAEAGMGLAYATEAEVASRKLERVLEPFAPSVSGLFLYYPRAARSVPNLRAFVTCAQKIATGAAIGAWTIPRSASRR
jgi:DNA-binding transcriptional LysR family regulator